MPDARVTTEVDRGDDRRAPGRRVPGWAWWGGGAVLALVAGGIAIGAANAAVYSPEAQVQDYLDALSAGDGGAAMALVSGTHGTDDTHGTGDTDSAGDADPVPNIDLPSGTATSLLQGEPLQAGMAALGELTVTRGADAPDGRSTEVSVGYTVEGEERSTVFTVERAGRDWLFFDRWRMAAVPVRTVEVVPANLPPEAASTPLTAAVNGVQAPLVTASGEAPGQAFAVLPPMVVDAGVESTFLQAEPSRLVVDIAVPAPTTEDTGQSPEPLALDLALQYTDAVADEVNRQLDAYLAGCTEQKVLQPAGCPMGYDTVNRIPPESISWTVAGDPAATVVPLPAEGGDPTVMAPLEAEAVLTLQEIDLVTGEQQPVEHRDPFTLEADLAVTAESVRLTPKVP